MKEIATDARLVGACGLYCGACGAYRRGRCPGCRENAKAAWCKVRTCCREKGYASCADCAGFPDATACGKFNNVMSRVFGFLFRSDRAACIRQIRQMGLQGHAETMARAGRHSMPRA
jgi:hypothetical protein